jgi:hypothetical protein
MTEQIDMFAPPSTAPVVQARSTSVIGLPVRLPGQCGCCSTLATVTAGRGPHLAGLRCASCGRHRGWVSGSSFKFLAETVDRFGRPKDPIAITPGARNSSPG